MDVFGYKFSYAKKIMEAWKLSAEEQSQLLPDRPTLKDCDDINNLRNYLRLFQTPEELGEASEEEQSAFEAEWLRAAKPTELDGKTFLTYVDGQSQKLTNALAVLGAPMSAYTHND